MFAAEKFDRAEAFALNADDIQWLTHEQAAKVENQREHAIAENQALVKKLRAKRDQEKRDAMSFGSNALVGPVFECPSLDSELDQQNSWDRTVNVPLAMCGVCE